MTDVRIRDLDEAVVHALRARARARGISLQAEIRSILEAATSNGKAAFMRRARAIRTAMGDRACDPNLDSARIIRACRDAWG